MTLYLLSFPGLISSQLENESNFNDQTFKLKKKKKLDWNRRDRKEWKRRQLIKVNEITVWPCHFCRARYCEPPLHCVYVNILIRLQQQQEPRINYEVGHVRDEEKIR